jgi:hypothetical protein
MTSLQSGFRQISNDSGYFISVSSCVGLVYTTPLGPPTPWASTGQVPAGLSSVFSTVNRVGTMWKDMGKSIVSSGSYFRKVQLVVPQQDAAGFVSTGTASTFGVAGGAGNTALGPDFFTGYVKLGFDGYGPPTPLAQFGR